jgi:phosphomannomutase
MTMREVNFRDAKIRSLAQAWEALKSEAGPRRAGHAIREMSKCPEGGQMALAVDTRYSASTTESHTVAGFTL